MQITLNIGREPGTWMPKEWAASGARLSLPMRVRFSDESVDMGFPGEEALNPGGGRYGKKVCCVVAVVVLLFRVRVGVRVNG